MTLCCCFMYLCCCFCTFIGVFFLFCMIVCLFFLEQDPLESEWTPLVTSLILPVYCGSNFISLLSTLAFCNTITFYQNNSLPSVTQIPFGWYRQADAGGEVNLCTLKMACPFTGNSQRMRLAFCRTARSLAQIYKEAGKQGKGRISA